MPPTKTSEDAETVIIGAGAAGLWAASALAAANHRVLILEARERLGGRILTDGKARAPVPIELGAEFIHGDSSAVMGPLRTANDVAVDASRNRWMVRGGKLRPAGDVLRDLKRSFDRISRPRRDLPFAEFLGHHRRILSPAVRQLACMMVEGFDAADSSSISTLEVLDEWSGQAAADAPTFRPARGYGALIESIGLSLSPDRVRLNLGTVVREIAWRKGEIIIDAQRHGVPERIRAARAIVTLPLGVLQLPAASPASVRFTPELRGKRTALAHLAAGPVIKVVMSFAQPFWAELQEARYRDAGFFFAPLAAFPTFWTSLPARTSILVAWSAGPNASRQAGKSKDEIIAAVLDSLRATFGRRLSYSSLLEDASWHDWQRDPFSCGAYSYVMAKGASARRSLAESVEDTLFFAGEACDAHDAATVGGALQSGTRVAQQVLKSVAHRSRRRSRARH